MIITHHGSIGIEALALGLDVVCSKVSPYADLGLTEKSFASKLDLIRILDFEIEYDFNQSSQPNFTDKLLINSIQKASEPVVYFGFDESHYKEDDFDLLIKIMDENS